MNEFFEIHQNFDTKKIIFFSLIVIFLIFIIVISRTLKNNSATTLENQLSSSSSTTFFDKENILGITLPKKYNLSLSPEDNNEHILNLKSDKNLNISITKTDLIENKTIEEICNLDKEHYITNFENVKNVSNLTESKVKEYPAYTYTFNYSVSDVEIFFQTIWIKCENNYYILDVSFPQNDFEQFTNLINEILNSFEINNK